MVVFLGAGIGGALRHGVNLLAARAFGGGVPAGTFVVNLLGAFLIGICTGWFAQRAGLPQHLRLFIATGLLGGFTTFSAFSLDAALLIERHSYWTAAAYVIATVVLGLLAFFAGLALVRTGTSLA